MVKIALTSLLTSSLFIGCSGHQAMEYFNKNEHYERAMTSLQIGSLVEGLKTKVIFKAIYLNQTYLKRYQEGENFFISTYIDGEPFDEMKKGLFYKKYALALNGKKATKIIELSEDDPLRLDMPVTERWNRYYQVRFDEATSNDLNLTFSHEKQGTIVLKYAKDELEK